MSAEAQKRVGYAGLLLWPLAGVVLSGLLVVLATILAIIQFAYYRETPGSPFVLAVLALKIGLVVPLASTLLTRSRHFRWLAPTLFALGIVEIAHDAFTPNHVHVCHPAFFECPLIAAADRVPIVNLISSVESTFRHFELSWSLYSNLPILQEIPELLLVPVVGIPEFHRTLHILTLAAWALYCALSRRVCNTFSSGPLRTRASI